MEQHIDLPLRNFAAQARILRHPARFKVVQKGRRFGMTRGAAHWLLWDGLAGRYDRALWADVSYQNAARYVEQYFLPALRRLPPEVWEWRKTAAELRLHESFIDFRGSERPENLEGFAYDRVFLNEAGIILEDGYLWEHAVRPMLLDSGGAALVAGTPKGCNYFYELARRAERAQAAGDSDWRLFRVSTFDNPLIARAEIEAALAQLDERTARQEIYGEFVEGGDRLFAYAFRRDRHVGDAAIRPEAPLYLSFDFNVDPITCVAAQHEAESIRVVKEYALARSDIYALCARLRADWPDARLYVTGDASGQAGSALTRGAVNYYTIIRQELQTPKTAIKLPRANPSHVNSRALVNSLLARHADLTVDAGCNGLIADLEQVQVDDRGRIDKRDARRTHLLDAFRYYLHAWHGGWLARAPLLSDAGYAP